MKRRSKLQQMLPVAPSSPAVIDKVREEIQNIDDFLSREPFLAAVARINNPNAWYASYGAGASIEQLARQVDHNNEYQILYRQFSSSAHANDVRRMLQVDGANVVYQRMRSGDELKTTASLAATILLRAIKLMLGTIDPQKILHRGTFERSATISEP